MRIVIAAVGRIREPEIRRLLDDYYQRIRRYAQLDEVEIRDERDDRVLAAVDKTITNAGPRAELIALDAQGQQLSSKTFAHRLGDLLDRGAVPVFVIGGAEGLPPTVQSRAAWKLSLGPMTLPHRLARLVLVEQIYRSFTILHGEPYAREERRG